MSDELTTAEKLKKLPWSIGTSALISVFMQLTFLGSVFVLFLDTLGLSKTQIGFLLSLLPYTGLIALFIAPMIARFGYKRTFVSFNAIRAVITAFLLLTPWVVSVFGPEVTLAYVTLIVIGFSLTRSVVVTAYYPWVQEYVPSSIQGKFSAMNNLFTTLTGFISVTFAGFMLDLIPDLTGFMILIAIGVLFGFGSVWTCSRIPGGVPVKVEGGAIAALRNTVVALRDKGLLFFLIGVGLVTFATVPLTSFVPLFMQEEVGLSSGNVVLIQTGMLLGGLASTYLWGWLADRYGSRPIVLSGISLLSLLPLLWMLMPRNSPISLYVALAISFLHGVADMGWIIGSTRLLYVSIVSPEKKTEYTALYYACVGVFGGTSQLVAGQIVQYSAGVSGEFYMVTFDPYTPLFVLCIVLAVVSNLVLRQVRSDTTISVEEFAGMFLHGNPFMAMTSLIGYHFARDESSVVAVAERLGGTRSPFTVDELLELLHDPRFNVRFETIISIARTRPHPRLTEALIHIFNGTELALSNIAAWALGRIGDKAAVEALREGLHSKYHSIQGSSARALGRLGDTEIKPLLVDRLHSETDKGLQMAYASTLGNLRATEATLELLSLLCATTNDGARRELALAVARLVGDEGAFIQLMREARTDLGTPTSQALSAFKKRISKELQRDNGLVSTIEVCANSLAKEEVDQGIQELRQVIDLLPLDRYEPYCVRILRECHDRLGEFKTSRTEYLLLAIHTMMNI